MFKNVGVVVMALALGGAFLLGWWPEHQKRVGLEGDVAQSRSQARDAEALLEMCRLQDQLYGLLNMLDAQDFNSAQAQSTSFFDAIRAATARSPGQLQLEPLLAQRDAVTGALARGDQAAIEALRAMRVTLHGLCVPGVAADRASTEEAHAEQAQQ